MKPKAPTRLQTPSPSSPRDNRRLKIVEAVVDCIAEEGIENLSAFAIAKRTMMQRSHITYYFPNQEALIQGAIELIIGVGLQFTLGYLESESTPEGKLKAWVDSSFDWFENHPKHGAVLLFLQYCAYRDTQYRALNARIARDAEKRVEGILYFFTKEKKLSAKKIELLSQSLRQLVVGALFVYYTTDVQIPLKDFKRQLLKDVQKMILDA
jgi:TetR/AcrR family fatty acid metabolism transcriptional regulator